MRFLTALIIAFTACAPLPQEGGSGGAGRAEPSSEDPSGLLVPPGFGSLRQDDITVTLVSGQVQVKITPLAEWIVRLTAPDTYQRLSGLRKQQGAGDSSAAFLVSFYSEALGQEFSPEDVELENRGRTLRPVSIRPMTSGWGTQRLPQRQAQSAVYAFSEELDLTLDMLADYQGVRSGQWSTLLRDLEAERSRARARAGGLLLR